jgi:hypothetical protein
MPGVSSAAANSTVSPVVSEVTDQASSFRGRAARVTRWSRANGITKPSL